MSADAWERNITLQTIQTTRTRTRMVSKKTMQTLKTTIRGVTVMMVMKVMIEETRPRNELLKSIQTKRICLHANRKPNTFCPLWQLLHREIQLLKTMTFDPTRSIESCRSFVYKISEVSRKSEVSRGRAAELTKNVNSHSDEFQSSSTHSNSPG